MDDIVRQTGNSIHWGVLGACVAITMAVGIILVWSGWRDYHDTFARGAQLSRQAALLAGEHTSRQIGGPEHALRRIDEHFQSRDPASLGSAEDQGYLRKIIADIPQADVIAISDRTGKIRLLSKDRSSPHGIDISDRLYFQKHLSDPRGMVIGPLIKARAHDPARGPYRFTVSKPLIRDGEFAGVALVTIFADCLENFLKDFDLAPDAAVLVLTRDGMVIARHQILPEHLSNDYSDTPLFKHLSDAPSGTYTTNGATDGIQRVFSYHALPDLPLVAVAGLPVKGLVAEWASRFGRNAMAALGLLAVTWGALWAVWRGTVRERKLIQHLEKALDDNKVLFSEIHHRVKNNMQVINSMLMMEQVRSSDPVLTNRLETLAGRISSMALVHVMLYERREASDVDMCAYLHELCANLSAGCVTAEQGIRISVECDGSVLPMEKAVPVGLLVNEAVSNAIKHAFPNGGRGGTIHVSFAGGESGLLVSVGDDGIGLGQTAQESAGLGLTIMKALAAQLGGSGEFVNTTGTVFRVWCPAGPAPA